jgi:hypothetical protein
MASETRGAGTAANLGSGHEWTNLSNVLTDNGNTTESGITAGTESRYLRLTNFGFAISGTIDGIELSVRRFKNGTLNIKDRYVRPVKSDDVVGSDVAKSDLWGDTAATVTYGGATSLLGTTWTDTEINASDTGFAISAWDHDSGAPVFVEDLASIEYATLTVHYTPAAVGEEIERSVSQTLTFTDSFEPGFEGWFFPSSVVKVSAADTSGLHTWNFDVANLLAFPDYTFAHTQNPPRLRFAFPDQEIGADTQVTRIAIKFFISGGAGTADVDNRYSLYLLDNTEPIGNEQVLIHTEAAYNGTKTLEISSTNWGLSQNALKNVLNNAPGFLLKLEQNDAKNMWHVACLIKIETMVSTGITDEQTLVLTDEVAREVEYVRVINQTATFTQNIKHAGINHENIEQTFGFAQSLGIESPPAENTNPKVSNMYYERLLALYRPSLVLPLNESAGVKAFNLVGSIGTWKGATPTYRHSSFNPEKRNKAISISASYIQHTFPSLQLPFTFSVWFNTASADRQALLSLEGIVLYLHEGKLKFTYGAESLETSISFNHNAWHFASVICRIDGFTLALNSHALSKAVALSNPTSSVLNIGRKLDGDTEYFNGSIDEVIAIPSALTVSQLTAIRDMALKGIK